MATRTFSLNTDPHVAQIGDAELKFQPEILGDEFLDGYTKLSEAQKAVGGDEAAADPVQVRKVTGALREFLSDLMLPESREVFANLRLPDRVLIELTEWVTELYGGGANARPTGRSGGSAPQSRTPGTRSKGSSPSRA